MCFGDLKVGVSIFKILLQITRPRTVVLGSIPGSDIYRNVHHYKQAVGVPGFLILSIEAPINFANSMYLNERFASFFLHSYAVNLSPSLLTCSNHFHFDKRILRWIEEYEEEVDVKKHLSIQYVILDLSGKKMERKRKKTEVESFFQSFIEFGT